MAGEASNIEAGALVMKTAKRNGMSISRENDISWREAICGSYFRRIVENIVQRNRKKKKAADTFGIGVSQWRHQLANVNAKRERLSVRMKWPGISKVIRLIPAGLNHSSAAASQLAENWRQAGFGVRRRRVAISSGGINEGLIHCRR